MKIYINAGFGELIGKPDLDLFAQLGFQGVRQDMPLDQGTEAPLIEELAQHSSLDLIALVNGGKMHKDPYPTARQVAHVARLIRDHQMVGRAMIEVGNEPNITEKYGERPELLAEAIREADLEMQTEGLTTPLIVGGIMTTDRGGLDYLESVVASGIPLTAWIGYHTYRTTVTPETPHKGFATRGAEFRRLQNIAGGRPLINTEIGWHTALSKGRGWGPFKKPDVQWSDRQVFDFMIRESHLNNAAGAVALTLFQVNDGPSDHYESHFGIRYTNKNLKPVSQLPVSV
jgi:hypothetical protein